VAEKDFLRPEARDEARRTIEAVERQTSAEVVVAVRRVCGRHREADYLAGFLAALATLVALLFLPREFALWAFPLDVTLAFLAGAFLTSRLAPLRRLLVPAAARRAAARGAAQLEFAQMRLSRLPGRNAILVYLALFERAAIVIPDLGIDPRRLEPDWARAVELLEKALARADWAAALDAVRGLGPALARAYPRSADDVNELPDEMTRR
jgi:uncharacterized membrane protein